MTIDLERLAREAGFEPVNIGGTDRMYPMPLDAWLAKQAKFAALVLEEAASSLGDRYSQQDLDDCDMTANTLHYAAQSIRTLAASLGKD